MSQSDDLLAHAYFTEFTQTFPQARRLSRPAVTVAKRTARRTVTVALTGLTVHGTPATCALTVPKKVGSILTRLLREEYTR